MSEMRTVLVSEVPLFSKTIEVPEEAVMPQQDKLRINVWVCQSVSHRPTTTKAEAEARAPLHPRAILHRRFSHTAMKLLQY